MKHTPIVLALMSTLILTGCSNKSEPQDEAPAPSAEHDHQEEHDHDHAPHHGIMVPMLSNGIPVAYAEVKLHDDKGDIEVWLTADEAGTQPFDLPLDARIDLITSKLEPAGVVLKVRNTTQNEDENGNPTIRNNQTNYFIFPGDTGEDASRFKGKEFVTPAQVRFYVQGALVITKEFELRPHVH